MESTERESTAAGRIAALRRLGYRAVPELVADLAPAVGRGHHLAVLAAEGSGKEVLYAHAAAEQGDPESPAVQALVLSPTREGTLRAARALHVLGAETGLTALAWSPWSEGDGERPDPPFAQLLASRPAELLPEIRAGRLGLGALHMLAIDGVTALEETGQWEAVEALLDTLGPEAQKIAVDFRRSDLLEDLLRRQLPRARKWPRELFEGPAGAGHAGRDGAAPLLCATAGTGEGRLDALGDALRRVSRDRDADRALVACPDEESAHAAAASLAARGFELTDEREGPGVVVAWGDQEREPPAAVAAHYGLPGSLDELEGWLGGAGARIVVCSEVELAQLRLLAARARWPLELLPGPLPPAGEDRIARFRARVATRIREADDTPELLVLEPLLEEFGASRVAAALAGLQRRAGEAIEPPAGDRTADREAPGPREAPSRAPSRPGERRARRPGGAGLGSGWTRLFINAGTRDDVGPGDLVGAITGETSVVGGQIGQIEVRSNYSLVDVNSGVAEEVMRKMEGSKIRGREVTVRPDRES